MCNWSVFEMKHTDSAHIVTLHLNKNMFGCHVTAFSPFFQHKIGFLVRAHTHSHKHITCLNCYGFEIYAWLIPPFSIAKKKRKTHTQTRYIHAFQHSTRHELPSKMPFSSCTWFYLCHRNVTHVKSSSPVTCLLFTHSLSHSISRVQCYHFDSKEQIHRVPPTHAHEIRIDGERQDHLPHNRISKIVCDPKTNVHMLLTYRYIFIYFFSSQKKKEMRKTNQ